MSEPLIYAVMPTTIKRSWIAHLAVRCFERQTYKNVRLLVGHDEDWSWTTYSNDQIEFVTIGPTPSVGVKYNRLHEIAVERGAEFFCLFPDDDWQAPDYIERRMTALLASGKDRVGCRDMYFYEVGTDTLRLYHGPKERKHWSCHGSLLYHRSVWDRAKYPDKQPGTDSAWQEQAQYRKTLSLEIGPEGYVAVQHGANTYRDMSWNAPVWEVIQPSGAYAPGQTGEIEMPHPLDAMLGPDAPAWRAAWSTRICGVDGQHYRRPGANLCHCGMLKYEPTGAVTGNRGRVVHDTLERCKHGRLLSAICKTCVREASA